MEPKIKNENITNIVFMKIIQSAKKLDHDQFDAFFVENNFFLHDQIEQISTLHDFHDDEYTVFVQKILVNFDNVRMVGSD